MRPPRQEYYSSLAGFGRYFETGVPVLMYHKVGPIPPGVMWKGLYVSPKLLARQLTELHAAGFSTVPIRKACASATNNARKLVLTFDDGFRNVLDHALAPLAENGFQAIQFLVPGLLGGWNEWDTVKGEVREALMDASQVRDWLAAGHQIGAHTMTHPDLTKLPLAQAREEIVASKKALEDTFGLPVEDFCYPYGQWNPALRDLVVEAGFKTSCVTGLGINTSAISPFEIHRYMARRPSPRPKEVLARVLDRMLN